MPLSASHLAKELNVSRQIIVGDVALLRASGENIFATPRGYILESNSESLLSVGYTGTIACKHSIDNLLDELYTIVDFGGTIVDVTIDHPVYGQLSGSLDISSRYDADLFFEKLQANKGLPLCELTGGIHLHQIGCKDEASYQKIKDTLIAKKIALK